MKKKFALILAMAMLVSVLFTACGGTSSSGGLMDSANTPNTTDANTSSDDLPTVTWKMGSVWGSGNCHFEADQMFAETVSFLTGGKFTITNYAEGELCAANQLFDYVSEGTIQCGGSWGGYWSGRDTAFEILGTIMDDFTGMDYYLWYNHHGGKELFDELYGAYGMKAFALVINGSESGLRSTVPMTNLSDLQSAKIRLGGVMAGKAAQKLGINITSVPAAELYESLQRGVVDAGEFSGPWADDSLKLTEVAKYWILPGWYQSSGLNDVIINIDAWNALPAEYQEAIEMAAQYTLGQRLGQYHYNDFVYANQQLADPEIQVMRLDDETMAAIHEATREAYKEECEVNPNFAKVYNSMMDYKEFSSAYREMLEGTDYNYGWGFDYDAAQ